MGGGLLRTFYTLSVEEEMHNLRVVIKVYLGSLLEVLLKKNHVFEHHNIIANHKKTS